MSYRHGAIAAAALSLATLLTPGLASAADLPVKAAAKPIADVPFFFVIDDRVMIPGAQPHELFERVMEKLGIERSAE